MKIWIGHQVSQLSLSCFSLALFSLSPSNQVPERPFSILTALLLGPGVKDLATKPDGMSLIPGTHMIKEESWLSRVVAYLLTTTYLPRSIHLCLYPVVMWMRAVSHRIWYLNASSPAGGTVSGNSSALPEEFRWDLSAHFPLPPFPIFSPEPHLSQKSNGYQGTKDSIQFPISTQRKEEACLILSPISSTPLPSYPCPSHRQFFTLGHNYKNKV